jgi:prepilin-type N-terminal cleavage/methylation domain-containing protein
MRRSPTTTNAGGVTLLELLVAVAILATVAGLLYGTFSRTFVTRALVEARARQLSTARTAVDWLERDVAGCGAVRGFPDGDVLFVSSGVGERPAQELDTPLLHLTTASSLGTVALEVETPDDIGMGSGRGDQARVLYRLEAEEDADGRRDEERLLLVRYEWRPPRAGDREEAGRAVLARGVRSLRLRFSVDGKQWKDAWDSREGGDGARVPAVVETSLVLHGDTGADLEVLSAKALLLGGRRE